MWMLMAGLYLALVSSLQADDSRWPPFLPPRASVPEAALVERTWVQKTFQRSFSPPPVNVPIDVYTALIDSPDVVAGAARELGIASETAGRRADGSYELRSPDGSEAIFKVLVSEPNRRAVLSYGHVVVWGLEVKGSVLGILDLREHEGSLHQQLTAQGHVENTAWAFMTRFLLALVPSLADKELSRGFRIAADVATWAWRDRDEFCAWFKGSGFESPRVASAAGC
jgi:hypothetical protein